MLPLSHSEAQFEEVLGRAVCGAPELQSAFRGGAKVLILCCLLAKELFQEAGDSGVTQRIFQELLTGATGVSTASRKRRCESWHATI